MKSSEETLRYCVEQDLEDVGFNVIDVLIMETKEQESTTKIRDPFGVEHDAVLVNSIHEPYLEYEYKATIKKYNPNYGDNRMCVCGHPYHRHFDPYEDMDEVCGCKYCSCRSFIEIPKK